MQLDDYHTLPSHHAGNLVPFLPADRGEVPRCELHNYGQTDEFQLNQTKRHLWSPMHVLLRVHTTATLDGHGMSSRRQQPGAAAFGCVHQSPASPARHQLLTPPAAELL